MDFLDPKRKKAHRQRLLIGYILMAVAVAMGTLVLLFAAYGFDIDRKTGDVIQNGIVYIDSKPGGASLAINGVQQKAKTASRLALPTGQYTFDLTLDGYRAWKRTFSLDGGRIEQIVYPFLIPNELKTTDLQLYSSAPGFGTMSPDRHWLLVQQPGQTYVFDMYDLSAPAKAPIPLTLPKAVLTDGDKPASLTVVDWSNDNRHFLLDRKYGDKHEFLVFDREAPADTFSLNAMFGVNPTSVTIRNKRNDQYYFYDAAGGVVRSADTKNKTLSAPILQNVLNFTSYNDDILLYVAPVAGASDKVEYHIQQGDKNYLLRSSPAGSHYVMTIAEYDNHWFYAVGSSNLNTVFIYKDPITVLRNQNNTGILAVTSVMHITDPQFVSVSANSRFLAVQSGSSVVTYDAYDDRQYKFTAQNTVPDGQQMKWMDGNRLTFNKDGSVYFVDFDGFNEQKIVPVNPGLSGPFFDRDYDNVFTLSPSVAVSSRSSLTVTPFKAEKP